MQTPRDKSLMSKRKNMFEMKSKFAVQLDDVLKDHEEDDPEDHDVDDI